MNFSKEDENYIYNVIGRNIKKYRKLKGLTQAQLAEKIDYSLSFVSSVESRKHQTFSLGALWRISLILEVDMYKLCVDEDDLRNENRCALYKCDNCGNEIKMPKEIITTFNIINKMFSDDNKNPKFNCPECGERKLTIEKKD